jgi:hypothetical protein
MAHVQVTLPAPTGNGSGAAVDVTGIGAIKTITVTAGDGVLKPSVIVEVSNQSAPTKWAPIAFFQPGGEETIPVVARWMRATVTNYRGGSAPQVEVGGEDGSPSFVTLVATAGNGTGAGVDVSALGPFKTVHVAGPFQGAVNIEISEDGGTTYQQALSFQSGDPGIQSGVFAADFMRVTRNGVPDNSPGLPLVNVGAVFGTGGSDGPGVGRFALPEQWAQNEVAASQAAVELSAQVSTNFDTIAMMRTGSLVGLCYRFSEEITAGTASITATINGVATALSAAVATGNQVGVATALEDEIPYEAGDLVGVIITTSGTFAPVTTDLEVWMQAQEDE